MINRYILLQIVQSESQPEYFHLFHTDDVTLSRAQPQPEVDAWSATSDVSSNFEGGDVISGEGQVRQAGVSYNTRRVGVQLAHATGCTVCVIL